MSLILTRNKQPSIKIDATGFDLEDNLQEYIHHNPDVIPLYDIKDDIRLCVLAREFATSAGPIDAVGVDRDGELYIIETKLYRNSDKRKVVAQVLDYAASLWTQYRSAEAFINDLDAHIQKHDNTDLTSVLSGFFALEDGEDRQLIEDIKSTLTGGSFKLVVLMDALHQQLKDLIVYINQNSEFDIFAVELEHYKHDDMEITIPKLFGAQIKKDITHSTKSLPDDQSFIQAYADLGYEKQAQAILEFFNNIQSNQPYTYTTARRTPKYLNFYIQLNNTKLSINLYLNPSMESAGLEFWFDKSYWTKETYQKMKPIYEKLLPGIVISPPSDNKYGKFAVWPISKVDVKKFADYIEKITAIQSG
jgi:hypothetical protein